VTCEIAGRDCLTSAPPCDHQDGSLLDHVRDDTIGLSGTSVIGRASIPEHLQGRVSTDSILATERLVLSTVDLGISTAAPDRGGPDDAGGGGGSRYRDGDRDNEGQD
jgi:hypothetical protein